MGEIAKLTICPEELAEKHRMARRMREGYRAMSREQKELANMAAGVEHEVIPEWKLI